jgi:glycerophosphoryl diester phosphodiesterase
MLKIHSTIKILATLIATACGSAAPCLAKALEPLSPGARPLVVAPGGYTRQAPVNTARPLAMAGEDDLDYVELEIRRTKDGQHVVFNTDQIDGKTSGAGAVGDHTLAELQALDAGSWFAKRFAGAKVLSLVEALDLAKNHTRLVLVCQDVEPAQLVEEVNTADMQDRVAVTGTADVIARIAHAAAGKIAILGRPPASEDIIQWAAQTKPNAILLPAALATAEICRALHNSTMSIVADCCSGQDNREMWEKLTAAGVDAVRTNLPEEFLVDAISRRVDKRPVQIAAHRGQLRYAPENTVASLEKADHMLADFVEIDVQTTGDGAFYLLHDGTLDRTTNGHGRVRQNTAETLGGLDAGSWFGLPFVGTPVPELQEYLAHFPPQMGLYFDAKDITPEALAAAVARHGLVERTVVYQGPVYLEKLKQIDPRIRLLSPVGTVSHVDTLAKRLAPYAVDTPWKLLSRDYIAHCHELGIKVFSDAKGDTTVDGYAQAIEWGIDLIQTDHPLRLWRAMEQLAAKP